MEGMAAGMAGLAEAFRPSFTTDMPVNLEQIAKVGREAVFGREARRANGRFNPSKLASPCLKHDVIERILLKLLEEDADDPMLDSVMEVYGGKERLPFALKREKFDYRTQRTFDVGHAIHEMEQQKYFGPSARVLGHWGCSNCHREETKSLMPHPTKGCTNVVDVRNHKGKIVRSLPCAEHGVWRYKELHFINEKLQISGYVDIIVQTQTGELVIVDIKTMDPYLWEKLEEPQSKDAVQLQIYMWLLGATYGILRYINKGAIQKDIKHFCVTRDPKVEKWTQQYIDTVNGLVDDRRWEDLGGVCNKKTQARAKRCPFNFLCF